MKRYDRDLMHRIGGYLDGEGCFLINTGGTPQVLVGTCFPEWPRLLQRTFGGTVRFHTKATARTRSQWAWYVCGPSAVKLCEILLGFGALLEKQSQAECLISWYKAWPHSVTRRVMADELKALKRIDYAEKETDYPG